MLKMFFLISALIIYRTSSMLLVIKYLTYYIFSSIVLQIMYLLTLFPKGSSSLFQYQELWRSDPNERSAQTESSYDR